MSNFGDSALTRLWTRSIDQLAFSVDRARVRQAKVYALMNHVHALRISPSLVRCSVSGSQLDPFAVTIDIVDLSTFDELADEVRTHARLATELLAGRVPQSVAKALIPDFTKDLAVRCTCPIAGLCIHVMAALYQVGAELESDATLLLRLRGLNPDVLVAEPRSSEPTVDLTDFYGDRAVLPSLPDPATQTALANTETELVADVAYALDPDAANPAVTVAELRAIYTRLTSG